jgi:hypothetical protein
MDINRLLAYERVPNSVGREDPTDVGEQIANQLFTPPQHAAPFGNILFNPVSISIGKDTRITGGMAFYEIPLGNPGSYKAWHSHIRLWYMTSSEDQKAFQDEKFALSVQQGPGNIKPGDFFNSTTLSVQWSGARAVAQIMSKAVQQMFYDSQGKITFLKPAVIDGTRFVYQFQSGITMGPADVAAALSAAIGNALPAPDKDHPEPRMPTIKVSNLQTYIS